jgi:membrane peptidoglycan carboxypeptidase
MFEVYLNVIEYGPMLYGIGPACMFYFGKRPCDITLNEAIFLSSLLPHPKWFKYSFDKEGNIKAYLADYFRFIGKVMFGRKLISENEYNDLKPSVDLYRDAKRLLNTEIDINPDSLDLLPNE